MAADPTRALVDSVADAVTSPSAARRLDGVHRLVALADDRHALRQPVVTVLGAYLRRPVPTRGRGRWARPDAAELGIRRTVLAALRTRLSDPDAPTTWCGLVVDLRDAVLAGDLSGLVVTGGAVRLDRAVVARGTTLDLSGAHVLGGALSLDRARVDGTVDATGLVVDGGEVSLDRCRVAGTVALDHARLERGGLWLREARVDGGTVSLHGLEVTDGRVSLHGTDVRGGLVRLDGARLHGGALHLGGATVESGTVRLDDLRQTAGTLSLALTDVRGGVLSLEGARVDGEVRVEGLCVEPRARVVWGPLEPVAPPPAPAVRADRRELDLRGPAPEDRWAWLGVPTARTPGRHDLPSRREAAAS